MLDNIGYTAQSDILGKRVFEPSFGKGVFLFEIVDRLVAKARLDGVSDAHITDLLNACVCGVECDKELFQGTVEALTKHVESLGVSSPSWDSLIFGDALAYRPGKVFDLVIGNPPYIRTHNLSDDMRFNVESFPLTAVGTPNLYVTFMEYGLSVMKSTGKLSYIIPNTWLKNTSQKALRDYLFSNRLVESIYDFVSEKVFSNTGTYTAVVVLSELNDSLTYAQKERGDWVSSNILYSELESNDVVPPETWLFQSPSNQKLLQVNRDRETKFGDICYIQNALMTMKNSIYTEAVYAGVEEEILYDAVKASTYRGGPVTEKILFPYKVEDGNVSPYTEEELRQLFPKAYDYLLSHEEALNARKRDASADWFHYGRSQGVKSLPVKKKIVFRQHISGNAALIDAHILPETTLVYGGWYIMEKEDSGYSLEDIQEIMESEEFADVMRLIGKDMSGGYKELYSKHLKAFGLPKRQI